MSETPDAVIQNGHIIDGRVTGTGLLQVLGVIRGEVELDGTVLVDVGGLIEGTVVAEHVIVAGTINGITRGRKLVEITEDGQVLGNCETPRLVVADGGKATAQFGMIADELAADIAPFNHASIRTTNRTAAPARQTRREGPKPVSKDMPAWMGKSEPASVETKVETEAPVEVAAEEPVVVEAVTAPVTEEVAPAETLAEVTAESRSEEQPAVEVITVGATKATQKKTQKSASAKGSINPTLPKELLVSDASAAEASTDDAAPKAKKKKNKASTKPPVTPKEIGPDETVLMKEIESAGSGELPLTSIDNDELPSDAKSDATMSIQSGSVDGDS
ncbi:MAG: hypothetical protein CMH54_12745 [Myxococcales bacterium]|nr:hypothetical protein [Myxococcales bacterium]